MDWLAWVLLLGSFCLIGVINYRDIRKTARRLMDCYPKG